MKLISLNTWGGKIYEPLIDFIKQHSADTDIFCFQEVFSTTSPTKILGDRRTNLFQEISKILENHRGYFRPQIKNFVLGNRIGVKKTDFDLYFGLAIFIRKEISVSSEGDFFLYGKKFIFDEKNLNTLPRSAQYLCCDQYTIINVHGIWNREGKQDSPDRIKQSEKINNFLKKTRDKKILCGDFNLDINTESLKILEKNLINLIKKFDITTTRNKFFPGEDKFADYTFVSHDVRIKSFEVPSINVSDHLPMILEFS